MRLEARLRRSPRRHPGAPAKCGAVGGRPPQLTCARAPSALTNSGRSHSRGQENADRLLSRFPQIEFIDVRGRVGAPEKRKSAVRPRTWPPRESPVQT